MAVDNWLPNWQMPIVEPPIYRDTPDRNNNYANTTPSDRKPPLATTILPFFLSLNLIKPTEKNHEKHQANYVAQPSYYHPLRIKAPFKHSLQTNRSNSDIRHGTPLPWDWEYDKSWIKNHNYSNEKLSEYPNYFRHNNRSTYRFKDGTLSFEEKHKMKPLERTGPLKTWYRWKLLDFAYTSDFHRAKALLYKEYIPENNLPLGIEMYKHRIFLSMPKWKMGVPISLAQLPRIPVTESPQLVPYPSWEWHSNVVCDLIISVFRMQVDECGRMWILDSGKISVTTENASQRCPPKLLIFDLETDELLDIFVFPNEYIKEDGLYSNIMVDIRNNDCHDNVYAYMSDVWRFGLVVFRLHDHQSWLISDHLFYPDPLAGSYKLHDLEFNWMDGLFGMALGPLDKLTNDRMLYFHPMSSFREFYVRTSYLRNESNHNDRHAFKILGQSRGPSSHLSASAMDKNGILYHLLVTRDTVGCWDSHKPYRRENLGVIASSRHTLVFPNDIRLDHEDKQSMWIVTNKLPYFLMIGLDAERINFRIMSAYTDESIEGTICDPNISSSYSTIDDYNSDCYY